MKRRGGLQDSDAVLDEGVDELGGGGEIGLVGRDDVAARIAQLGVVQHGVVELGGKRPCARPPRRIGASPWAAARRPAASTPAAGVAGRRGFQRRDALRRDGPGIAAALLDGIAAHPVDVVEQRLAVARGHVENRAVVGHVVIDGLPVVPLPAARWAAASRPAATASPAPAECSSASGCR